MPEFDIVAYGATGFTGRLILERLAPRLAARGGRLAAGGRSPDRLHDVMASLSLEDVGVVVADAFDSAAVRKMAERTRMVVSTGGPYTLYGETLVATCADLGVDYFDLCGEPLWQADMIGRHRARARDTGARLVFSAGFDSVPFDLAVFAAQLEAVRRWGAPAEAGYTRVMALKGSLSGGTRASGRATAVAVAQDPAAAAAWGNPYLLADPYTGDPAAAAPSARYDPVLNCMVGPFMMAPVNTKVVHRTNMLLRYPWGEAFAYEEAALYDEGGARPLAEFDLQASRARAPGEGPDAAERAAGGYELVTIATLDRDLMLRQRLIGAEDPGYGFSSRLISHVALRLLETPRSSLPGGCWTPAAALGEDLITDLQAAGALKFDIVG